MASKRQRSKAAARRRSHARESGLARGKSSASTKKTGCPIVGVGGSAGGFEAGMELLRHLPAKNGMAFVIVQHLDPHHASRLAVISRRRFGYSPTRAPRTPGIGGKEVAWKSCHVVVKPPGRFFKGLPAVSGLTILGDGQVAPILNVAGLLQHHLDRARARVPAGAA